MENAVERKWLNSVFGGLIAALWGLDFHGEMNDGIVELCGEKCKDNLCRQMMTLKNFHRPEILGGCLCIASKNISRTLTKVPLQIPDPFIQICSSCRKSKRMTPERILSFDFETANHSAVSICAAGVAIIENGQLVGTRHWLVRPPQGHGWFREDFIGIHGITHEDVMDAPEFPTVAGELFPLLSSAHLVIAHNASFDVRTLRSTLQYFGMQHAGFPCLCTLKAARAIWPHLSNHKLDTVASHVGYAVRHHNAEDDAKAAGLALLAMMNQAGTDWIDPLCTYEAFGTERLCA